PQSLPDVVDVDHEDRDADQGQNKGDDDGRTRHLTLAVGPARFDLPNRQQGVHEGRNEQADGDLARPVPEGAVARCEVRTVPWRVGRPPTRWSERVPPG